MSMDEPNNDDLYALEALLFPSEKGNNPEKKSDNDEKVNSQRSCKRPALKKSAVNRDQINRNICQQPTTIATFSKRVKLSESIPRIETPTFEKDVANSPSQSEHSIVGNRPAHWGKRLSIHRQKVFGVTSTMDTSRFSVIFTDRATHIEKGSKHPSPMQGTRTPPSASTSRNKRKRKSFSPSSLVNLGGNSSPTKLGDREKPAKDRRKKLGKWSHHLISIRERFQCDQLRFQSGQYPLRLQNSNPSDPRNQAECMVDISVVGNMLRVEQNQQLSTMLAYVHEFRLSGTPVEGYHSKGFSWITFKEETLRKHRIKRGSNLRLYNVTVVKLCKRYSAEDNNSGQNCNYAIQRLILCTEMCEPYPQNNPVLLPVPDIPSGLTSMD